MPIEAIQIKLKWKGRVSQKCSGLLVSTNSKVKSKTLPHPRSQLTLQMHGNLSSQHHGIWWGSLVEPGAAKGRWAVVLSVGRNWLGAHTWRVLIRLLHLCRMLHPSLGSCNRVRSVAEVAFLIAVSHIHADTMLGTHGYSYLSTARSWLDFRQLFPLYCSSLSLSFLISSMAHFSFNHYWLLPPLFSSPPLSEHRVESKGLKIKHITPTYTQQKRLWHLEMHGLIMGWKT